MKTADYNALMRLAVEGLSDLEYEGTEDERERFEAVLRSYRREPGQLVIALRAAHETFGCLPAWVFQRLSEVSKESEERIRNLARFLAVTDLASHNRGCACCSC